MSAIDLALVPGIPLNEANAFVRRWHRHHAPVRGCLFIVGAARGPMIVGVAIVGRPVSRELQADGYTAEVTRLVVALDSEREGIGEAGGGSWSRDGRPRVDTHPTQAKLRWEAT